MSVLGAILGKRTWLGAGAILLSAAGGCALGALLVVCLLYTSPSPRD